MHQRTPLAAFRAVLTVSPGALRTMLAALSCWLLVVLVVAMAGCGSSAGGAGGDADAVPLGDAAQADGNGLPGDSSEALPLRVVATLAKKQVVAGETTTVTCAVEGEGGEALAGFETGVEAPEGVTVTGYTVSATVAGEYEITCVVNKFPDIDKVPDTLAVVAAAGVKVELYADPEKDHYIAKDKVKILGRGFDAYGNLTGDVPLAEVSVAPQQGVDTKKENGFVFQLDGHYTFTGSALADPAWSDTLDVVVDGTGPVLTIETPEHGTMLDPSTQIVASGTAVDATSAVASVDVNGEVAGLGDDGSFSLVVVPEHGQNFLLFTATDTWGNATTGARAYQFSSTYMTMDTPGPNETLVPGAVVLYLRRDLFYDDANPGNPSTLSGIVKMLFTGDLLSSLIPNPAADFQLWPCDGDKQYNLVISNVKTDPPSVVLAPVVGGLALDLAIQNFSADFDLQGSGNFLECPLGGTKGTIMAQTITSHLEIQIFIGADGQPAVTVADPTTEIAGLSIQGQSIGGVLLQLLMGLVQDLVANAIETVVKGMIQDQLTQALQDGLAFLANPIEIPFDLPIGAGIPVLIVLYPSMQQLQFAPEGAYIELAATIRSEKKIDLVPRGAIRRDGCLGTESTGTYAPVKDAPVEAALYDDVLNQALFSVWYNGALSIDLTAEDMAAMNVDLSGYGITNFSASIRAKLPPILEGCGTGPSRLLQAGDLYLHAIFDMLGKPVDAEVYLYAEAEAVIQPGEKDGKKAISIVVSPLNLWFADLVSINEEWKGNESMFSDLLNTTVKKLIEDAVTKEPLSFELPAFALSSLAEGLPEDQGISVDITALLYEMGYTIIKGAPAIVAVEPAPPEETPPQ
jgi:hypothetical protein